MQHHVGRLDEEMKNMEDQLYAAERERDKTLDELRAMKKLAQNANQEIQNREKTIESLKFQLEEAKGLELKLTEKEVTMEKLKADLAKTKASLSESERRALELETEMAREKESGTKMFDSLVTQMKKLEETQFSLEESKLEIASLHRELKANKNGREQSLAEDNGVAREVMESLKSELYLAKDNLASAKEVEKLASLKAESLVNEIDSLRSKLKLATVAEETSKKALDDLALALKEVATEASQVKEELGLTKAELEHSKSEEERLKLILESNDEKYRRLLEETRKEAERYKNTAERLRLEAEETLLAWNEKEIGLVDCLRRADEERASAQQENSRLLDVVGEAENKTRVSKEENGKLRDILKQALSESNTAKEAAEIARAENSQLKDSQAEKEEALVFLTRENENYRLNEAAALENIKEFKRLLSEAEQERTKEQIGGNNKIGKTLSLNLKDMNHKSDENNNNCHHDHDHEEGDRIDETLKGSIFDMVDSRGPKTLNHHSKNSSSAFSSSEDVEQVQLEDFDGLDGTNFVDLDNDKSSRKKKALLKRFGDLLTRKKGFHKKEPSE